MRAAGLALIFACTLTAQFKSNVPLVVAPTTVTDSKGHYIDGLTQQDLILYDNNVPQTIQLSESVYPISLVVAIQTSANSGAVIDKLGRIGILLSQLLAADAGETAVLSFSDEVNIHQDFTANPDAVTRALRMLRKEGAKANILDALRESLFLLKQRPGLIKGARRRIILIVAEKRDDASTSKLPEVMERMQRLNVTVYWLTFSPFLEPFTVKAKTMEDTKPEAERIKRRQCLTCPDPDTRPAPADLGPGNIFYAIGQLARLKKPDLANLFTTTTGGRTVAFLKKNGLEQAIQLISQEVHRQYVLSFQPQTAEPGEFHALRVAVKDRPELQVTTRSGYWALQ
jgi:VWFA-related protein